MAVVSTTLSLLVIFVPLAFMQGIVGRFMLSFGLTMAFAIAISLVVAFVQTPMLCSRYLKLKVKRAVSFINDFELAVIREARRRGVDGVVCGHIHHAELRVVDGLTYANDGDWVESLTALVEHADGRLEIIDWAEAMRRRARRAPMAALPQPAGA